MQVRTLYLVLGLSASALPSVDSYADDDNDTLGWSYELLVGVEHEPTYVGSDSYQTEAGGDFEARYQTTRGHQYYLGLGGLGGVFSMGNNWALMTELEFEEGRDNGEDPILSGFAEVRDTVEGQVALIKTMGEFRMAGVIQVDALNRGKGVVYFLALDYEKDLSPRLSMTTTVDISFANAEHMNTEVGITPQAAIVSGLDIYHASSGYKSTTLATNFVYGVNKKWQLITEIGAEFYGSNITDSPLVRDEGSDVNYNAGLGLSYIF
jgi:outer membrane scaffolding protein for murein synthesis (MipA/OmpV family)